MNILDIVINNDEDLLGLYGQIKMDLHMLAAEDLYNNEDVLTNFEMFMGGLGTRLDPIFDGKNVIANATQAVQELYKATGVGPLVEVFTIKDNGFGYNHKAIAEFDPFKVELILDSGIRLVEGERIHTSTLVFHSGRELDIPLSPNQLGRLVDKYRTLDGKAND